MKYTTICPITDKRINERVSRINAAFTVLILILFALTQNIILIAFLAADFLFRAADYSKYSLVAITSSNIVRYLPVKSNFINAGPKIFAARIGFSLSLFIILAAFFISSNLSMIIAAILGLFSFLEAAFGLCVACKIYPFAYWLFYQKEFQE